MNIIKFNELSTHQNNLLSSRVMNLISGHEHESFFAFENEKFIGFYILQANEEYEYFMELIGYNPFLFSEENGYIYYIETFEKGRLRELLNAMFFHHSTGMFIVDSNDQDLVKWKAMGASVCKHRYHEYRGMNSLILNFCSFLGCKVV